MFGMGKDKDKKQAESTVFNLEQTLKNSPEKKKELIGDISDRIGTLKSMLREGSNDQKKYDEIAFLLHGYNAAAKVINRIK